VHLSDLHFTGRLTEDFFRFVVDRANDLDGDLVALTGDVIDQRSCLGWVTEILGRIEHRLGAFCIFGNHDLRVRDMSLLVAEVERAGWHYLGGRWSELRLRGHSIVLAGNELPWLSPPADLSTFHVPADVRRGMRILLSHSPDQIQWARTRDFDLMLAGHTHGGQIRLPVIGPLIGQSRYGVRYCSGVFHVPPTLLHVSRGVSGLQNLRINCRPELTKLILKCGAPLTVDGAEQAAVSKLLPGVPVPAAVSRS
jgi:predicted MPP superfamily phosphohydrolase